MRTFLLLFISFCSVTMATGQTELEEIRDNSYGVSGAVDLYEMGFENCDLMAIDSSNNQYVIDYENPTFSPSYLFLQRMGIHLTDDGYFTLEWVTHQNWNAEYNLTKYNSELLLETSFGQEGSYAIDKIPRWRAVDEQGRIYLTLRTGNYFKVIRTGTNEVTSLVEIANNTSDFKIAPNPTHDIVHISSPKKLEGDILCEVFDLNGQLLFSQYYEQVDFDLDLSAYAPGGYVVRLVAAEQSVAQLVLKR